MSALAVAVGSDGILVAGDGVCYDYESGTVSGLVSKIILLPEYDCFIGATGAGVFGVALRWEINQRINSFDELVDRFADLCETVHRKLFTNVWGRWDHGPRTEVSCVIGGWSDSREAFEAYRVVSYDKSSVDLSDGRSIKIEPFTLLPLPAALWCNVAPETMDEFDLNPPLPNEETVDIAARLICACRAQSGWNEGESEGEARFYMAGGFIQIAVIQRGCSQSSIIHRWPADRIGAQIDPSGSNRYPGWLKERFEQAKAAQEVNP